MPDRLIVDANIVVASLLRDGTTRRILLTQNPFELFSPDFLKQELAKYVPEFSERLDVPISKINASLNDLLDLAKIQIVPKNAYEPFVLKAQEISPDLNDVAYFALALKLDCPIWSQDAALKKQSQVKIVATSDLVKTIKLGK